MRLPRARCSEAAFLFAFAFQDSVSQGPLSAIVRVSGEAAERAVAGPWRAFCHADRFLPLSSPRAQPRAVRRLVLLYYFRFCSSFWGASLLIVLNYFFRNHVLDMFKVIH